MERTIRWPNRQEVEHTVQLAIEHLLQRDSFLLDSV